MSTSLPDLSSWSLNDLGGRKLLLPQSSISLGSSQCDINIQSRSVDKQHAVLSYNKKTQSFMVKDLGSGNGTFVNDKEIPKQEFVHLSHGDLLRFGFDPMLYQVEQNVEALPSDIFTSNEFRQPANSQMWAPVREQPPHQCHMQPQQPAMTECKGCLADTHLQHVHSMREDTPPRGVVTTAYHHAEPVGHTLHTETEIKGRPVYAASGSVVLNPLPPTSATPVHVRTAENQSPHMLRRTVVIGENHPLAYSHEHSTTGRSVIGHGGVYLDQINATQSSNVVIIGSDDYTSDAYGYPPTSYGIQPVVVATNNPMMDISNSSVSQQAMSSPNYVMNQEKTAVSHQQQQQQQPQTSAPVSNSQTSKPSLVTAGQAEALNQSDLNYTNTGTYHIVRRSQFQDPYFKYPHVPGTHTVVHPTYLKHSHVYVQGTPEQSVIYQTPANTGFQTIRVHGSHGQSIEPAEHQDPIHVVPQSDTLANREPVNSDQVLKSDDQTLKPDKVNVTPLNLSLDRNSDVSSESLATTATTTGEASEVEDSQIIPEKDEPSAPIKQPSPVHSPPKKLPPNVAFTIDLQEDPSETKCFGKLVDSMAMDISPTSNNLEVCIPEKDTDTAGSTVKSAPLQQKTSPLSAPGSPRMTQHEKRRSLPGQEAELSVFKGSPLYGKPAWWGDDEAANDTVSEDHANNNNGVADRPDSLALNHSHSTNLDEVKGQEAKHQYTPAEKEVSQDASLMPGMAFTINIGDDFGGPRPKFGGMKDSLSKFVPKKVRKGFKSRSSKDEKDVKKDQGDQLEVVHDSEKVQMQNVSSDEEEERCRSESSVRGKKEEHSWSKSPSSKSLNREADFTLSKQESGHLRSTAPSQTNTGSSLKNMNKTPPSRPVNTSRKHPESFLIERLLSPERQTPGPMKKHSTHSPTMSSTVKHTSQFKTSQSGLKPSPKSGVKEKILYANNPELVIVKDDPDNISESGTYTIDKDANDPVEEETENARRSIDQVFGVDVTSSSDEEDEEGSSSCKVHPDYAGPVEDLTDQEGDELPRDDEEVPNVDGHANKTENVEFITCDENGTPVSGLSPVKEDSSPMTDLRPMNNLSESKDSYACGDGGTLHIPVKHVKSAFTSPKSTGDVLIDGVPSSSPTCESQNEVTSSEVGINSPSSGNSPRRSGPRRKLPSPPVTTKAKVPPQKSSHETDMILQDTEDVVQAMMKRVEQQKQQLLEQSRWKNDSAVPEHWSNSSSPRHSHHNSPVKETSGRSWKRTPERTHSQDESDSDTSSHLSINGLADPKRNRLKVLRNREDESQPKSSHRGVGNKEPVRLTARSLSLVDGDSKYKRRSYDTYSESESQISAELDEIYNPKVDKKTTKTPLTKAKPNRAFQLRRARSNTEGDVNTLLSRSGRQSPRVTTSSSRPSSRPSSAASNRITQSRENTPKRDDKTKTNNDSILRKDGGRHSLRAGKVNPLSTPKSSTRVSKTPEPRSEHRITTARSASAASKPLPRSQSPKSQEYSAWKRRSGYDPRKAIADSKMKSRKTPERSSSVEAGRRSAPLTMTGDYDSFKSGPPGDDHDAVSMISEQISRKLELLTQDVNRDDNEESYESLVQSSVYHLSVKLKMQTESLMEKLRGKYRLVSSPSPLDESMSSMTSVNPELMQTLQNLQLTENIIRSIDRTMFPGSEKVTPNSRDTQKYMKQVERIRNEMASFRPITQSDSATYTRSLSLQNRQDNLEDGDDCY